MTLDEFERTVFQVAYSSALCGIPEIYRRTPTSETVRVPLVKGGFVDAFFNAETGTMAFAYIRQDQRVFGADNTGGWHLHPFENPAEHRRLTKEMTFVDFILAIERHYANQGV